MKFKSLLDIEFYNIRTEGEREQWIKEVNESLAYARQVIRDLQAKIESSNDKTVKKLYTELIDKQTNLREIAESKNIKKLQLGNRNLPEYLEDPKAFKNYVNRVKRAISK